MSLSKESVDRIKRSFLHQNCVFYLRNVNVMLPTDDGEGISTSAAFEGFIVDIDEHAYYIGNEHDGTITKIIPHDTVGVVELMSETVSNFEHLFEPNEGDIH